MPYKEFNQGHYKNGKLQHVIKHGSFLSFRLGLVKLAIEVLAAYNLPPVGFTGIASHSEPYPRHLPQDILVHIVRQLHLVDDVEHLLAFPGLQVSNLPSSRITLNAFLPVPSPHQQCESHKYYQIQSHQRSIKHGNSM